VLAVLAAGPAAARDFEQWENIDPITRAWFGTLMQPDNPTRSCCAEGDAYWADVVHVETDERGGPQRVIAEITDERDDGPLGRVHENIGTRYGARPQDQVGQGQPHGAHRHLSRARGHEDERAHQAARGSLLRAE
jgi:hypothetical protein